MTVPLEKFEGYALAKRLDKNDYTFSGIRNESDSHSIKKGAIRKASGVRKGISDFCIILKSNKLLFIELKRQIPPRKVLKNGKLGKQCKSPSVIGKEQINWIDKCNKIEGVYAKICYGFVDATNFIIENEAR